MTLEHLLDKIENYEKFAGEFRQNGNSFLLGNHQLMPIFDAINNGLRRFLLAYGTGAGKTTIPIEIIKHLRRKEEATRTLIVAPYQTMLENWNEDLLRTHGCLANAHYILDKSDALIPEDADFVVVNYDKLPSDKKYNKNLVDYAREADQIIVDECHNIKNRNGAISKGFQEIIEESKNARLIALSASPAPNRLRDFGMVLYLIDPDRYQVYRSFPFSVEKDPEAIWELREKGQIRFFDRSKVAEFFDLPKLIEREPIEVEMQKKYTEKYFDAFKGHFETGKTLYGIERISIEAILHSDKFKEEILKRTKEGYALNFFSHLRKSVGGLVDENAIFSQLEQVLKKLGIKKTASIHGEVSPKERLRIQKEMSQGKIDALINQWRCTYEGFSEVAGDRKVSIIPLRSPFEPGVQDQIIGRSYRPGQSSLVEYVEFHAVSQELCDGIDSFVREYAAKENIRVKSTWTASLFHNDVYLIRKGKERKIKHYLTQRSNLRITDDSLEVNSIGEYARSISKRRIVDESKRHSSFGSGTRDAVKFVGTSFEEGLLQDAELLGKDYAREDVLLYTPGKINIFLANVVEDIKKHENKSDEEWKIADLGSCSSVVFSQARSMWQALQKVRGENVGLDNIVNVDGVEGFTKFAKDYFERGQWIETINQLSSQDFSRKEFRKAYELLKKDRNPNKFVHANFINEDFGNNFDVAITSQSLQYNNQTENRDIESALMNINRSLKTGGHYLIALTGNTFTDSFTRPQDVENILLILDKYGFCVNNSGHIQGKSDKKTVVKPFHFIHATKTQDCERDFAYFENIPSVYTSYFEILTGGSKIERLRRGVAKQSQSIIDLPEFFTDAKGETFNLYD